MESDDLLELVSIASSVLEKWSKIAQEAVSHAVKSGIWEGSGADEDARIDPDGSLVIFAQLGSERPELRVEKADWVFIPFSQLAPEHQLWVASMIAANTPRDRASRGTYWQGKLFGHIAAKGYIPPDGRVLRFKYLEEGPYQAFLGGGAAFGYSIGSAAPEWAKDV